MTHKRARTSGIGAVGELPWGSHFCQFYHTREDLLDTLVPYFKAGLENNEFCLWVVSEPLRADAWDSYWEGRRSPTWFLTGGLNPLAASFTAVKAILTGESTGPTGQSAFARYLSPRLVRAYIRQDFCWIVTSSNYWGLTLSDPKVADRAASYYRALKRHGYIAFSASPWGAVDSPGGPGHDKVPFDYDFTYDFYPLSYTRPGPYVQVYRLTDGRCNPAAQRRRASPSASS